MKKQQRGRLELAPEADLATTTAQANMGNDSRVIVRQREVLMFELAATEEHLNGLRAATVDVGAKKARIKAKIVGLTRVLDARR